MLDVGYGIRSATRTLIPPNTNARIRSGISFSFPEGVYGYIVACNGLALLHTASVETQIIDGIHKRELYFVVFNHSATEELRVPVGECIALLTVHRHHPTHLVYEKGDEKEDEKEEDYSGEDDDCDGSKKDGGEVNNKDDDMKGKNKRDTNKSHTHDETKIHTIKRKQEDENGESDDDDDDDDDGNNNDRKKIHSKQTTTTTTKNIPKIKAQLKKKAKQNAHVVVTKRDPIPFSFAPVGKSA